jgi:hypothetical protein
MNRWQRFRRLAHGDRRMLLGAMLLLPLTALGLRVFGFRRWGALLTRWEGRQHVRPLATGETLERGQRAARMVAAASREGLVKGNCLSQSLVLCWLLRRAGASPDLRVGMQRSPEGLKAHAWVELQGTILNDSADVPQRYAPFEGDIAAAQIRE